jgi:short-subunit dehydrogenase
MINSCLPVSSNRRASARAQRLLLVGLSETLYKELIDAGSKIRVSVLCPGLVKSRILDSERNRPVELSERTSYINPKAVDVRRRFQKRFDERETMTAIEVADYVFDAITEERLYVLTHKHLNYVIEERMNNILQERNPTLP